VSHLYIISITTLGDNQCGTSMHNELFSTWGLAFERFHLALNDIKNVYSRSGSGSSIMVSRLDASAGSPQLVHIEATKEGLPSYVVALTLVDGRVES